MKCDNTKCQDYDKTSPSHCSWLNGSKGVPKCDLRINPNRKPCMSCGRPADAKSYVKKTVVGWMCKYCRASGNKHINLLQRFGQPAKWNGKIIEKL